MVRQKGGKTGNGVFVLNTVLNDSRLFSLLDL